MELTIFDDLAFYLLTTYYTLKAFFGYRVQASFYVLQNILSLAFNVISVTVIYSVSSGIAGWSFYQLLFLTNLSSLTFGILLFVSNPGALPRILRQGQLDNYMPRPYGLLTLVMVNAGASSQLATVIGSTIILAVSATYISFSLSALLSFIILYLAGVVMLVMFLETLSLLSYYLFKSGSYIKNTVRALASLGKYPLSIYGFATTIFFTLLIPIGLASYYPSKVLFGTVGIWLYLSFLLVALAFTLVCYKTFNRLMRSYESGGG